MVAQLPTLLPFMSTCESSNQIQMLLGVIISKTDCIALQFAEHAFDM